MTQKLTHGHGFNVEGAFVACIKKKHTKCYGAWIGILRKSYSERFKLRSPTYRDCTMDSKWHNYQVFAKWYHENQKESFELDKDILIKRNKIYSPETCCFVPKEINLLFVKRNSKRGPHPIGVSFHKKRQIFYVIMSKNNKNVGLGTFNTAEEAFLAYKHGKEKHIKEVAEKWKDKIDKKAYLALINYKVEITD